MLEASLQKTLFIFKDLGRYSGGNLPHL